MPDFMLPLLTAVLLVGSPKEIPAAHKYNDPIMRMTLQMYCKEIEILDEKEIRYNFASDFPANFMADLKSMRERYVEYKDAPLVSDSERLMPRETVSEMLSFNRQYLAYLESNSLMYLHRQEWYREAISETNQLYAVWDTIRDCRCEYYYVTGRRASLKKLKELVGPEAYYSGSFPPHVPVWRFNVVK